MEIKNPNFDYYFSKLLNLKYAVHKKTKEVFFEDGVKYTLAEIMLKKNLSDETIIEAHKLKKAFGGNTELVKINKKLSKEEFKFVP